MCDTGKMQEGASVDLPPLTDIYKIRPPQCYTFQGKFVKLVPPEGFDYRQFAPPKVYGSGEKLPPGVYTYMFPTQDRIVCVPVKNKFELGTVHYVLALLSGAPKTIAAGELLVQGDGTIYFNLLSGSFMKDWMERGLREACNNELRDLTLRMLQQQYPKIHIEHTNAVLITDANVPVTAEELDRYARMGLEVRLYSKKGMCMTNPVTIEEQIKIQQGTNARVGVNDEDDQTIAYLRSQLDAINSSYEVYRPSSGGKRRKSQRKLQKRRKTRRL